MFKVQFSRLFGYLLLAGAFSAIFSFNVNLATAQVPENSSSSDSTQVTEQLVGRWEFQLPYGVPPYTAIFAPNGQFFELRQPDRAVRYAWAIDFSQQPPQVIINYGLGLFVGNLSGSEMQMQVLVLVPQEGYQLNQEILIQARKLSSDPTLPVGVTVTEAADFYRSQADLARQTEAKTYVGAVNRSQQAYHLEHQQFANTQAVEEYLGTILSSDNYDYQIFLSEGDRVANVLAIPKRDGLKAYVGRVTVQANGRDTFPTALICESINPTRNLPGLPTVAEGSLQCPADYQLLN